MMQTNTSVRLAGLAALAGMWLLTWDHAAFAGCAYPGVAHSTESIACVRAKREAKQQPWTDAWETLKSSREGSLSWTPRPRAHVERGASNRPNIGSSDFSEDAATVYIHALCWTLAGDTAHAEKAAEIVDAWSGTLEAIGNHDARLLVGMSGYKFTVAAELLRHTWDGWLADRQARFARMARKIWCPIIEDFYPSTSGNWDASVLRMMMTMGVFLDDQGMFDRVKDYFPHGEGNGAIGNHFKPSGQCQKSGRDQGHTQMGLDSLAAMCETAWIQGIDLCGALDNRLLKDFEYTVKYDLGFDVPYEPYRSYQGRYHYPRLSDESRGRLRTMYERVLNHYHNRKGLETPLTRQAAHRLCAGGVGSGRRRGGADAALETRMFAEQPAPLSDVGTRARKSKTRIVCFGDSIAKRGYPAVLADLLGAEVVNGGVGGNDTGRALHRMKADVLTKHPDVVIILFGTNDLRVDAEKVHVPVAQYAKNLHQMIARCREQGVAVVLCTLPPIDAGPFFRRHARAPFDAAGGLERLVAAYRDAAAGVADEADVPLVDLNGELAQQPAWMSADGVHPTAAGNAIIAGYVARAVRVLLGAASLNLDTSSPGTVHTRTESGAFVASNANEAMASLFLTAAAENETPCI